MDLYKRVLGYLSPYKKEFIIASVFMVIISATSGGAALIIQPILDDIFMKKDSDMLAILPIGIIVIYLARGLGRYFASSIMQTIGQSAVRDLRNNLFDNLQKLSFSFYSKNKTGAIISRITNDVQMIQDAVSIVVYEIVRESLTMVALLCVVFYRDPYLAAISLLVIPFSGALIGRLGRSLRSIATESQARMADMNSMLVETFGGIRIVQAFGMEKYETERFAKANEKYFDTIKRTIRINELSSPLMEFIGAFGIAAIIYYGGSQVIAGKSSVGTFFSFITALFMLYQPISKLSRANNKIQQAMASAKRIFELIDTPKDITDKENAIEKKDFQKSIVFDHVSFSYEAENVLSDISLTINKGEVVALVGSSGAGKSTLVNLLPRFFDVTEGSIKIDGIDIRDMTVKSLRAKTGIVTQEIFLFADSIANNIAYGHTTIDKTKITDAARSAYADDFINELPEKYETTIGERGVKLSGGQRQRISIARAIMKNPELLILDEATSALDSESERMVQQALSNLMRERTVLVIAHRLSTIKHADKIVVIEKGRIIDTGRHDELLDKCTIYQKLCRLQFDIES